MRSSVIAKIVLAAASALSAGGALGCNACKEKKEDPKEAEAKLDLGENEVANDPDELGETPFGKGRTPRADFIPITTAEVAPLIPTLTAAAMVGEPKVVAGGRRINVVQCVTNEPKAIQAEFEKKLNEIGFAGYKVNTRPRKDINLMSAEKDGIRVSAALRTGEYPDCPISQKKAKLFLTYFKPSGGPRRHRRHPGPWEIPKGEKPGQTAPAGGAPATAAPAAPGAPAAPPPSGAAPAASAEQPKSPG